MIFMTIFFFSIILMNFNSMKDLSMKTFLMIICMFFFIPLKNNFSIFSNKFFMMDQMTFFLMLLTILLTNIISVMETNKQKTNSFKNYFMAILILMFICWTSFMSIKIMNFFILFEMSLIPIFIIIMGWGYQPERQYASMLMILYTISCSMPLLLIIMILNSMNLSMFGTNLILLTSNSSMMKEIMMISSLIAFLVKLPMFLIHVWLPQAHVEAPVTGSMILAAILLKLGGFGLWRMTFLSNMNQSFIMKIIMTVSFLGGAMAAILCIQQSDMKVIIAYSSVSHMGLAIASCLFNSSLSLFSILIIFLAHGFSSSALFFSANEFYSSSYSRSIFFNKSILMFSPVFSSLWFLTCLTNMAGPPSFNLTGEILASLNMMNFSNLSFIPIFTMMMFAAIFNLILFSSLNQSQPSSKKLSISFNMKKIMILFFHIFFLFFFSFVLFLMN